MLLRPINQRLQPGFRTMINNGSFCFDIKSLFQDKKSVEMSLMRL